MLTETYPHYANGYAAGRASAAAEIRELIESEINMYRQYTPEQKGKLDALTFILPYIDKIGGAA